MSAVFRGFTPLFSGVLFLLAAPVVGQSDACPADCLPGEAVWIAGIRLGATLEDVQRTIGSPTSRAVGYGEDDGGRYEEIALYYPGLEVFMVRGIVDRVVATADNSCTASGICPGMTAAQVRNRIVDISEQSVVAELRSFYVCDDGCYSDYYLLIDYDPAGKVERLRVETDRP